MKVKHTYRVNIALLAILLIIFNCKAFARPPIIVVNKGYQLIINADKGTIQSFKAANGGDGDELLIPDHGQLPLFKIELMSDDRKFQVINSSEAKKINVTRVDRSDGPAFTFSFEGIGNLNVNAKVTLHCPSDKPLTYWGLEVDNQTKLWIGHIQFPVVEIPFDKNPTEDNCGHILSSLYDGVLLGPVQPLMVAGSWRASRRNTPETWRATNYPRECTIQMMAYYTPAAGLYMAAEDPNGLPKLVAPLVEQGGVTLGMGHFPGTQGLGITKIPYQVVMGTFHGDWYNAAAIYRDWAEKQPFCTTKIKDKTDYPQWLLKPLVGVAFPMRGQGDWDPPAAINPEYSPATNALPYLTKLANGFGAPLMPIIFNWEHAGPWVQPGAFPPVGGESEMKSFLKQAKAKGWHPILYGNGVNWVIAQKNTGYDGTEYFNTHGGPESIIQRWNNYNAPSVGWRTLYSTCVATEGSRKMILAMTKGIAELEPDAIQQFDQGVGAVPCYASNHGHPPVPGPWMTNSFTTLLQEDNKVARSINPKMMISSEGAPPEVYMKDFNFWDARTGGGGQLMCPLYSFVYHEYINGHAGFYTNSVNDEALRASVARALVSGYMLNFTLRDKGQISYEWNHIWDRAIPNQEAILEWANRATQLRYGIAKDFLIYGRMLPPWNVANVTRRDYGYGKEPLVQSGTWKSPDGRIGIVLANYNEVTENPRITLEGKGKKKMTIYIDDQKQTLDVELPYIVDVKMPSRSLGLIELK